MDDEPRIYMRHARALNICGKGVRLQAERLGINITDFCHNGYPCSLAEKSGNPFLVKCAELARKEWEAEHGKG
jgi:hypothetical protein